MRRGIPESPRDYAGSAQTPQPSLAPNRFAFAFGMLHGTMAAQEVSPQAMLWFRCILVGLVTVIIASFVCVVGMLAWAILSSPASPSGWEVGWDLVTMWHNLGLPSKALGFGAIAFAFAVGFFLAYRSYSRLRATPRA
ncbi:MAG TPA: hypothetical protein VIC00_01835 [Candidatus Acidoferrales bacterium]|jgi:hypothetical protein